jgi:hypothetical protein
MLSFKCLYSENILLLSKIYKNGMLIEKLQVSIAVKYKKKNEVSMLLILKA